MKSYIFTLLFIFLFVLTSFSATNGGRLSHPVFQAFDDNGDPLALGKLYVYEAGTSTLTSVSTTYDLSVAHDNPVILDSRGEANIFGNGVYKFVLKDSDDVTLWTIDYVALYRQALTTTYAATLLDDADAATMRTTLGLGSAATLDIGTATGNIVQITQGPYILPRSDGRNIFNLSIESASFVIDNYLTGFRTKNDSSSPNTDIVVESGFCVDQTNAVVIDLTTASITKGCDNPWVYGNNNGGLDEGVFAADTWYNVFAIRRTGTMDADILISLSTNAPTMPSGWTYKRRIASIRTEATNAYILPFHQFNDRFIWDEPIIDVVGEVLTNADVGYEFTLDMFPDGITVEGNMNALVQTNTSDVGSEVFIYPTSASPQIIISPADIRTQNDGSSYLGTGAQLYTTSDDRKAVNNIDITILDQKIEGISGVSNQRLWIIPLSWIDYRGRF